MKIYLAGPMNGHPLFNFPAFHRAAKELRERGHEVASPAENDLECGFDPAGTLDGFDLAAAFRWDVEQILKAEQIALLPGWDGSVGATLERAIAEAIGIEVIEL